MVALRHDIHAHPELAYEEHRTSGIVANRLRSWGYDVHVGLGGKGVVATLKVGDGLKVLGGRDRSVVVLDARRRA